MLAPGALVDGATYVFELSATFDGVLGAASVELVAVSAPTAGSCSVVPTNASLTSTQFVALETKFVVSTSSWAAVDLPLSYAFRASGYGVVSTLAPFALRATVEDVYLPVGDVSCCVEINQCVGCTFFTKSFLGDDAAVLARSSGEEPASPRHRRSTSIWRSTRRFKRRWRGARRAAETTRAGPSTWPSLLARRSRRSRSPGAQFFLARFAASEALVDVRTSSVGRPARRGDHRRQAHDATCRRDHSVVGNLDAEKALVEAAAVASGVATGAALTPASANASLHAVAAMARLSAPLGVTATAADGLVGALSNVLGVTANVTDEVFGACLR